MVEIDSEEELYNEESLSLAHPPHTLHTPPFTIHLHPTHCTHPLLSNPHNGSEFRRSTRKSMSPSPSHLHWVGSRPWVHTVIGWWMQKIARSP